MLGLTCRRVSKCVRADMQEGLKPELKTSSTQRILLLLGDHDGESFEYSLVRQLGDSIVR